MTDVCDYEMEILVLFYTGNGATEALARAAADGVDRTVGAAARLRTVPAVSAVSEATEDSVPASGPPYATMDDLRECGGLLVGSPARFGNMAASLKYFFERTTSEWMGGVLAGKPAGVFTSSASLHGGQESTLITMMVPLLHHGMLIVGLPYTEESLSTTMTGGTPYGASHVTWNRASDELSAEEMHLAQVLGERVATVALKVG